MAQRLLTRKLLSQTDFWESKNVELPRYDGAQLPVTALCFSAGRMAYGHTGDIIQDLIKSGNANGVMCGIETYAARYCAELAACDYLMTQLVYDNEQGNARPKILGSIPSVLYVDANRESLTFKKMLEFARNPEVQFATINAPEGAYGVNYQGGEFVEPVSARLKDDLVNGSVNSDPARWTAFARARFEAGLPFAFVSCTNFSGNGHYTAATIRTVAKAWEEKGFVPRGFLGYVSDPRRFACPNTMIDRIAVPADDRAQRILQELEITSNLVVTEKARYWAIEDLFPAGRPEFEKAEGVFVESTYDNVKRYEDMKLRILNMSHSVIAGLGVLLGYRGAYGIYQAMQDKDIRHLIDRIIALVVETVPSPKSMSTEQFAKDTIARLNNPNIPDDPMRIALNASTKMAPRFMDTYFAAQEAGIGKREIDLVLVPVAGFLRYTCGVDDAGDTFELEDDPIKDKLEACGGEAAIGKPSSAAALKILIGDPSIMGKDLYERGSTGTDLANLVTDMLQGKGAVRRTVQTALKEIA
ncbi:MAG: hypothetical protein GF398_17320 [Chitinivibrionales bacterium]|nr:hypothetical protein [Chitinivibrionales bacterium]